MDRLEKSSREENLEPLNTPGERGIVEESRSRLKQTEENSAWLESLKKRSQFLQALAANGIYD